MDVTITINCDNAAFEGAAGGPEVARILRRIATEFLECPDDVAELNGRNLRDSNGNIVGEVEVVIGERYAGTLRRAKVTP